MSKSLISLILLHVADHFVDSRVFVFNLSFFADPHEEKHVSNYRKYGQEPNMVEEVVGVTKVVNHTLHFSRFCLNF